LVRLPFGDTQPKRAGLVGALVGTTVLKAPQTTLELTDQGREAIDTRLRTLLVSPGWLRTRYETLVVEYQRFLSRRSGTNAAELHDRRPEQDVHAPLVDGSDLSELRGDRWEFARMHAEGRFDDVLAEAADAIDLEVVYGPVLAEAGAQTLVGGEEGDAITVREFMQRILPVAPPEIGPGLVDELFSAADGRRAMTTFLWWPRGMLGPVAIDGAEVGTSRLVRDRAEGSVIVTAARTDVSGPFAHDRCLVSEG
jgi:hypothetical protein